MIEGVPYWRLSALYFLFFVALGILIPYFTVYFSSLGYSLHEVGMLFLAMTVTRIFSPYVLGLIADKTTFGRIAFYVTNFLAFVSFLGVFWVETYTQLMWLMLVFSFFWNAPIPKLEAMTVAFLGERSHQYSLIRVWGSIGFVVAVQAMGYLKDMGLLHQLTWWLSVTLALVFLLSLTLPKTPVKLSNTMEFTPAFWSELKQSKLWLFFAVVFLLQASHGAYYTYFSKYMEAVGYSGMYTSLMWSLGVMMEVGIMLVMHRLLRFVSLQKLLLFTLVLTTLRWGLISYFIENQWVLLFAQMLHAFSFGVGHAVAIEYIKQHVSKANQNQGQAFYASLGFGVGNVFGVYIAGLLVGVSWIVVFNSSVVLAGIGVLLAWWAFKRK